MFKMYLVCVSDLEDKALQDTAVLFLDKYRQECVYKYKREKDRVRAVAAGLLLQAGFLELDFADKSCAMQEAEDCLSRRCFADGVFYRMRAKVLLDTLYQIQESALPLEYQIGKHGKPYWDKAALGRLKPDKKLWHFNISHSGAYALAAVADCPIGVDIQIARETKYFAGGYKEFSRMEAYVKCTGEGYAKGIDKYLECSGSMEGYKIQSVDDVEGYALHICVSEKISG